MIKYSPGCNSQRSRGWGSFGDDSEEPLATPLLWREQPEVVGTAQNGLLTLLLDLDLDVGSVVGTHVIDVSRQQFDVRC